MNVLLASFSKETVPQALALLEDPQTKADYITRFPDIPQLIELWTTDNSLNALMIDLIQNHAIVQPFIDSFSVFYRKKDGKVLEALVRTSPKLCYQQFDFSAKVDIFSWLGVWGAFMEHGDAEVRKAVLEAKCFAIPQVIQKMKEKNILYILKGWKFALDDDALARTVKVAYFNKFVLAQLYEREAIVEQVHEFMTDLCTIPGQGVCFQDFGYYPPKDAKMKIYNKILQVFIPLLSISCPFQCDLLFSILRACPEILPCYYEHLSVHLSFDPRNSSKWIESMDLVGKLLDLPIPQNFARVDMSLDRCPPTKTLADNIVPVMLNKITTSKALQSTDAIIKSLTCLILEKCFAKLKAVNTMLCERQWEVQSLLDVVRKALPDVQIVISLLSSDARQQGMHLFSLYQEFFPDWVRSSRFDVGKCLDFINVPELVEPVLNFLLHFPTFKWYAKAGETSHLYSILSLMRTTTLARSVLEVLLSNSYLFCFEDEINILLDTISLYQDDPSYEHILRFVDKQLVSLSKHLCTTDIDVSYDKFADHFAYRRILITRTDLPITLFNVFYASFIQNVDESTVSFVTKLLLSVFNHTQSCDYIQTLLPVAHSSSTVRRYFDSLRSCIVDRACIDLLGLPASLDSRVMSLLQTPDSTEALKQIWTCTVSIADRLMIIRSILRVNDQFTLYSELLAFVVNSGLLPLDRYDIFFEHPTMNSLLIEMNEPAIRFTILAMQVSRCYSPMLVGMLERHLASRSTQIDLLTHVLKSDLAMSLELSTKLLDGIIGNPSLEEHLDFSISKSLVCAVTESKFDWLLLNINAQRARLACQLLNNTRMERMSLLDYSNLDIAVVITLFCGIIHLNETLASEIAYSHADAFALSLTSFFNADNSSNADLLLPHIVKLLSLPELNAHLTRHLSTLDCKKIKHPKQALQLSTHLSATSLTVDKQCALLMQTLKDYVNLTKKVFDSSDLARPLPVLSELLCEVKTLDKDMLKGLLFSLLKFRLFDAQLFCILPAVVGRCIKEEIFKVKEILNMVTTHSLYEQGMLSSNDETKNSSKQSTVAILIHLTQIDKNLNDTVVDVLTRSYSGSMHNVDRMILKYCQSLEQSSKTSTALHLVKNFAKLGPVQFPYESFDEARMELSITWFEKEYHSPSELYDPHFSILIFLHLLLNTAYAEKLDLHTLFSKEFVGMAIMSLSSKDQHLRSVAYYALDLIYTKVRYLPHEILREKTQIMVLFNVLKNAITDRESPAQIATVIALFFARSTKILLNPEDFMYPIINKCFLQRAVFDLEDIPIFYDSFYSSTDNSRNERNWLLDVLKLGDYHIYKRRFVVESFMSYFSSSLSDNESKLAILEFIRIASSVSSVSADMVSSLGITQMFQIFFESNDLESDVGLSALDSFNALLASWKTAEDTWHGKGGKRVWLASFENVNALIEKRSKSKRICTE